MFEGKAGYVQISDVHARLDRDCSSDMTAACTSLCGTAAFNQISAASIIHLPKNTEYQVKKKGASCRVSYSPDGVNAQPPS